MFHNICKIQHANEVVIVKVNHRQNYELDNLLTRYTEDKYVYGTQIMGAKYASDLTKEHFNKDVLTLIKI